MKSEIRNWRLDSRFEISYCYANRLLSLYSKVTQHLPFRIEIWTLIRTFEFRISIFGSPTQYENKNNFIPVVGSSSQIWSPFRKTQDQLAGAVLWSCVCDCHFEDHSTPGHAHECEWFFPVRLPVLFDFLGLVEWQFVPRHSWQCRSSHAVDDSMASNDCCGSRRYDWPALPHMVHQHHDRFHDHATFYYLRMVEHRVLW